MGRLNRFIWFIIMIVVGAAAGLYYAWYVKPANFVDAAFYHMRQDYKTDYVLMVAEIYDSDHNRLNAMTRLDYLRDFSQGETQEEVVKTAIRTAEGFGYNPIDLDKMRRLLEMVTGVRNTPTPQYDPTMEYSIQQTSTAVAISLSGGEMPTDDSIPQAESDPFGTGIIFTTAPSAVPELVLTPAPTITPMFNENFDMAPAPADDFNDAPSSDSSESVGFSGIPDDFFNR